MRSGIHVFGQQILNTGAPTLSFSTVGTGLISYRGLSLVLTNFFQENPGIFLFFKKIALPLQYMSTKKLIVFLLWAFLPMVIIGLVMHLSGDSTVGLPEDSSGINPLVVLKGFLLSAGAMFVPLLAVIFTQFTFKEPILKDLGISFKINRWWWIGWLLSIASLA